MTDTPETPKPTIPPAIHKSQLSQREKRRRRLMGERRAAAETRSRAAAKKGKPGAKPEIAYELDKKTGRYAHTRIDAIKPVNPSEK